MGATDTPDDPLIVLTENRGTCSTKHALIRRLAMEQDLDIALVLGAIEDKELPHLHNLMSRCWDRPMDFADATLVYLAKRESLSAILTVDHADFATYRIEGKRQFRILPADRP